ncbi:unnamed protein product, partial [Polarella glacialis]
ALALSTVVVFRPFAWLRRRRGPRLPVGRPHGVLQVLSAAASGESPVTPRASILRLSWSFARKWKCSERSCETCEQTWNTAS